MWPEVDDETEGQEESLCQISCLYHHLHFSPIILKLPAPLLGQRVNKTTRGDNILDLIFSTNDGLVSNVNTDSEFGTSDHKVISFEAYKENVSQ